MNEKIHEEENLVEKLNALEKWVETSDALDHIYKPSRFTYDFQQLALIALNKIKPEKSVVNKYRSLIFNIFYRIKIKEYVNHKQLIDIFIDTIKNDNISNISLAIKCIIGIVKRINLEEAQLYELLCSFKCIIDDVMNNFKSGNERLIESSLHVLGDVVPFLVLAMRNHTNLIDRFEWISRELFAFVMFFMSNNEFNSKIISSETLMIELVSTIYRLVRYFMEIGMISGRDFATMHVIPEICMFIMNFCPNTAENLKKEIYQQVTSYTIKNKDLFSPYIDIIISENILLKPGPISSRINGCLHSTEISIYFKDRINKETLIILIQNVCSVIELEIKGYECLLDDPVKPLFYFNERSIESLKTLVNSLIKITDVILHQKFTYYEKHMMYMKVFYEISQIFCGITTFVETNESAYETDAKTLIKICIRGLKNLMNHFGTIKDSTLTLLHSLKCFSQEEIAKFSRIFNYSIRLFSTKMFSSEDVQIFEELYSIFVYLEESNFFSIISTNLNFLIVVTEKNRLLFSIWRFYLGIKSISPTLFSSIIGYFISSDSKNIDKDFIKEGFDHLFYVLQVFPREVDHILSTKIEALIHFLVVTDEVNFYRYDVLNSLLRHMANSKSSLSSTFRSFTNKLDFVIRKLLKLFRYYQENIIFVELILTIPKQFLFSISKFKLFVDPILYAFETGFHRKLALEFLSICVDNLKSEFIVENSNNMLHTIIVQVLECMKHEELRDLALDVLFKYKGKTFLDEFQVPHNKQKYISKVYLKNEEVEIKIDSILERCIEVIRGRILSIPLNDVVPNKSIIIDFKKTIGFESKNQDEIKSAFDFLSSFIYVSIGWETYDDSCVIDRIKNHFNEINKNGVPLRFANIKKVFNEMAKHSHFIRIKNINMYEIIQAKQYIYDAIIAIFCINSPDINDDVIDFLKLVYFIIIVYTVIEQFRLHEQKLKFHFDYHSFIDPLLECFGKKCSRERAGQIMLYMYEKLYELSGSKEIIRKMFIFHDIIFKLVTFCYFKIDEKKKAGLYGIIFIIRNVDLEPRFILIHRCQIFRALFFYLQNASSQETEDIRNIIFFIIEKTYMFPNNDLNKHNITDDQLVANESSLKNLREVRSGFEAHNPDIIFQFILGIRNTCQTVREISYDCIKRLSVLRGISESELLISYKSILTKRLLDQAVAQKDYLTLYSLLDGLSKILLIRPIVIIVDENLNHLIRIVLKKIGNISENSTFSKFGYSALCYIKFLENALKLIEDNVIIENIITFFIRGTFLSNEISEMCCKVLKTIWSKYHESINNLFLQHFKPQIDTFLYDKIDISTLNMMIVILSIGIRINPKEVIEKLSEIFKIRGDIILFKALEITSFLPPNLPDIFLSEIVDVAYFLEQRNKLINNKRLKVIFKDICENNMEILGYLTRRINDFGIYKIMVYLVKNSEIIKSNIKENLHADENLYSILLAKEVDIKFTPPMCYKIIKVYQDLKSRNKDCNAIRNLIRTLELTGEFINMMYEIDPEFMFNDPKQKIMFSNLGFIPCRRLIENIYEYDQIPIRENNIFTEIGNIEDKNKAFFVTLEGFLDYGIDMDLRSKIISIFFDNSVRSSKAIFHCNLMIQKKTIGYHKALLYISYLEPSIEIFERLIYINSEFRRCIEKAIDNLVKVLDLSLFEKPLLSILKDQLVYRNHLFIIYPLLIRNPVLITYKIATEIFDVVCRLFSTTIVVHHKTATNLFTKVYEKYNNIFLVENPSTEESNIANGLSICYALFFSHTCHAKDETLILKIKELLIPLKFNFLFFVEENLNYSLLSKAIVYELEKDKTNENPSNDEEAKLQSSYKQNFINTFNSYIKKCFNDFCIHESFLNYVDAPFLLQRVNYFFETSENPKTAGIIFCHIIKLKEKGTEVLTNDTLLFELFGKLVNSLNNNHKELLDNIILSFINISPKLSYFTNIIKFLELIIRNKSFENKNIVIENSYKFLEATNISLTDKISFINAFVYSDDLNMSFILPFFNNKSDLMPALQQTFLKGLQSINNFQRQEFYDIFDDSISQDIFSRLRYLLNFDWVLYGDKWLYPFVRLCVSLFDNLKIDTFIVCVFGDDSFYENIYYDKLSLGKSNIIMQRLNIDINEFLKNNIDGFLSKVGKYMKSNIPEIILELLYHDYNTLKDFAAELLFKILKKLNATEIKVIVEDIIVLTNKCDEKENVSILYKALSRLVTHYQYFEEINNNNELFGQNMEIVEAIHEILSHPGFINIVKKTSCFIPFLNLVNDESKGELYLAIKEDELKHGYLKTRSNLEGLIKGLDLSRQNKHQMALDIFEELQMQYKNNEINITAEELCILEKEWFETAKKLQQWDILHELGNSIGDCVVSTEACFRNLDFFNENEINGMISVLNIRKNTCEKRFFELFIEFMTSNEKTNGGAQGINVIDNKLDTLRNDFMDDIQTYPYSSRKISESLTYLRCIDDMIKIPQELDLIPDDEDVLNWDFFTTFRIHMLNLLIETNPLKKYFHDKARVFYKFCKSLRKNGLIEQSLYFLQKIFFLPSIEAIDAYKKIISEVKVYYENEYYDNALEVLNCCNLNFFDSVKKANIFAWKARVYDAKGEVEEADRNILYSVQIDSNIGKNWYTWGLFLDRKIDQIMDKITTSELSDDNNNPLKKKTQLRIDLDSCLENTFACFILASVQTSGSLSRKSILRLLKYLRYENHGIIEIFESQKDELDITRFFFFIPQLISLFDTNSHHCAQAILMKLIDKYPQSMFLPLRSRMYKNIRANILSEKSKEFHQNPDTNSVQRSNSLSNESESKGNVKKVITNLFGASSYFLASTFFTLEGIVKDIIDKMDCTVEEDCYKISDAIFNESVNMIFSDSSYSFQDLNTLIKRLFLVIQKSKIRSDFKEQLTSDFNARETLSLVDVANISLKWKDIIENVLINMPILLNLSVINTLNEYGTTHLSDIHMFGQYSTIRSVYEDFVLIEGFEPAHLIAWKNGNCIKKIIILGSDGRKYHFAFCDPVSDVYRREDKCIQLADFLDCDMKYKLKLKSYVNLSEKYRLVRLQEPYLFLDDIFCYSQQRKTKPDYVIMRYIDYLIHLYEKDAARNPELQPENPQAFKSTSSLFNNEADVFNFAFKRYNFTESQRYEAYVQILKEYGENNIIRFFKEVYPCDEAYYFFKKEILKNYSVQTAFFYLLSVVSRSPNRIAFGYENGRIYNLDVFSCLGGKFEHDIFEKVPMRITPNLQAFFGREGIEGLFDLVGKSLCKSLLSNDALKDLCLVFLEELRYSTSEMFTSKKNENIRHRIDNVLNDLKTILRDSTNPKNLCLINPLWHPWF